MSASAARPVRASSARTPAARSGSFLTTTAAPSDRLIITVSECATTSCISRAIRFRSVTEPSCWARAAQAAISCSCSRRCRTEMPIPVAITLERVMLMPAAMLVTSWKFSGVLHSHVRKPPVQRADGQQEVHQDQRCGGQGQGRQGEAPGPDHCHGVQRKPQPGGDIGSPGVKDGEGQFQHADGRRHPHRIAAPEEQDRDGRRQQGCDRPVAVDERLSRRGRDQDQVAEDYKDIHDTRIGQQVTPEPAAPAGGEFSEGRVGRTGRRVLHRHCINHALSLDVAAGRPRHPVSSAGRRRGARG